MACPERTTPLGVIKFETERLRIRDRALHEVPMRTSFNLGEIESLLDAQTNPLVCLDPVQIQQIADDYSATSARSSIQKCPMCGERMSHVNFGGPAESSSTAAAPRASGWKAASCGGSIRVVARGRKTDLSAEARPDRRRCSTAPHEKRGTIPPLKPEDGTWSARACIYPSMLMDVTFPQHLRSARIAGDILKVLQIRLRGNSRI